MRRLLLAASAAALLTPSAAHAADPIMPLAEVRAGAQCTGLSVVRGTAISSFAVEVLDVLDPGRPDVARILVRVSGPAVDATGLGPGFSGSPILCPGADGVARNIGAISESIGEYGGKVGLATPIEAILAQPVVPPSPSEAEARSARAARRGPEAARYDSRPLAAPLTLGGVRASVGRAFTRAAAAAGRVLYQAPVAGGRVPFPPQPLRPGAAMSVGLAAGDISLGAVGTVAYEDAGNVWAFGHPFDGAGRRSLVLQDAFVHTVVNNPIAAPDLQTYKLASPGNSVGTVTGDGVSAITGQVGAPPAGFPLRVTARDRDTGRLRSVSAQVADEADVGLPTGASSLAIVGAAAVAEAASIVLGGSPARQSGEMCVEVALRELRRPLRFCNTYAVSGPGPGAIVAPIVGDFAQAAGALDAYRFGDLHPTNVEVGLRLRRGTRQAFIEEASAPFVARRGRSLRVRLGLRHTGTGRRTTRTIRVRVPRDTPRGERTLTLTGTPADTGGEPDDLGDGLVLLFGAEEDGGEDDPGPTTLGEVRDAFEEVERDDGVSARFSDGPDREVFRDPGLRISGRARVPVSVR